MNKSRPLPLWMRLAALVTGLSVLVWLPFEDTDLRLVLVFAAGLCAWLAARLLLAFPSVGRKQLALHLLVGTLAGLSLGPLALLMMAFKTGLHAHGAPDFTPEQLQVVLLRTPVWGGSGLLLGLGSGLWRLAQAE